MNQKPENNAYAMYKLGLCYYHHYWDGISEYKKKAAEWWLKAAALGNAEAINAIRYINENPDKTQSLAFDQKINEY